MTQEEKEVAATRELYDAFMELLADRQDQIGLPVVIDALISLTVYFILCGSKPGRQLNMLDGVIVDMRNRLKRQITPERKPH